VRQRGGCRFGQDFVRTARAEKLHTWRRPERALLPSQQRICPRKPNLP
jgi:hypothetical protein